MSIGIPRHHIRIICKQLALGTHTRPRPALCARRNSSFLSELHVGGAPQHWSRYHHPLSGLYLHRDAHRNHRCNRWKSSAIVAQHQPGQVRGHEAEDATAGRTDDVGRKKLGKRRDVGLWAEMLEELRRYRSSHGHVLVPNHFPRLGKWVETQRRQFKLLREGKQSLLTEDDVKVLEGEGFVWQVHEKTWEERFADLLAYKAEAGDCNVPIKYESNPQLGNWVGTQRTQYALRKRGRPSDITEERIRRLEGEGFIWDVHDAIWMERFNELRRYRVEHGDCLVPSAYDANRKLGRWVEGQRRLRKASKMTPERAALLDSVGFVWDAFEEAWWRRYEELLRFVEEHGVGKMPPRSHGALGNWVYNQRVHYRRLQEGKPSKLTEKRLNALKNAGFTWFD